MATPYAIKSEKGKTLAYIKYFSVPPSDLNTIILVSLLIFSFIFFISFLYKLLEDRKTGIMIKRLIIVVFIGSLFILYTYSGLFGYVRMSTVFQPESFAYSSFFPSMMSLLFGSLSLFFILLIEIKWLLLIEEKKQKKFYSVLLIIIYALVYSLFIETLEIIGINTSTNIDLSNIVSLNIVGIFGIAVLILVAINFLMVSNLIILSLKKSNHIFNGYDIISVLVAGILVYFILGGNITALFNTITLLILYGILYIRLNNKTLSQSGFYIVLAVLVSYIINYNLIELNNVKEQHKRQILIRSVALNQDPEAEYLFGEVELKIYSDSVLRNIIRDNWLDNDIVSNYIFKKYFTNI